MNQIRQYLFNQRRKVMKEFNEFDANTVMAVRIRNSERLDLLEQICEYIGQVRSIRWKTCILPGCGIKIADIGTGQKYCSDACRAKAYRRRKKLYSN